MSRTRDKELIAVAQRYGLGGYLRQWFTPGGMGRNIGERLFGSYADKMTRMREADNSMREALLGRGTRAPEQLVDLKRLLRKSVLSMLLIG